MAEELRLKKISDLPIADTVGDNDVLVGVQEGVTKRFPGALFADQAQLDALAEKVAVVFYDYQELSTFNGDALAVTLTKVGIQGTFSLILDQSSATTDGAIVVSDAAGKKYRRLYSGDIQLSWWGPDEKGINSAYSSFLAAAQYSRSLDTTYGGSPWVVVGSGVFLLDQKLPIAANWKLSPGAVLTGTSLSYLAPGSALNFDTSNLNGTMKRDFPTGSRLTTIVGDPTMHVQRFIGSKKPNGYGTLFSAEYQFHSNKAVGGVAGFSWSSARDGSDLSCIAVTGVVVNDNTTTPKPSWCFYGEAHRDEGAGNLHVAEFTTMNWGSLRTDTPYSSRDAYTANGDTYNLLLNTGGSLTDPVNDSTGAILITGKAKGRFHRGITFKEGSVSTSEAFVFPENYQLAWYALNNANTEVKGCRLSAFYNASDKGQMDLAVYDGPAGVWDGIAISPTSVAFYNDNKTSLGTASKRASQVYAATSTISTSDERAKCDISEITDQVLDAWGEVRSFQYKFSDALERKGDGARWHFGWIAQRVKEIFDKHGVDGLSLGLLCHDKWEAEYTPIIATRKVFKEVEVEREGFPYPEMHEVDEEYDTGERTKVRDAGDRYGIRYEEALVLEAAYHRRRAERSESRIDSLEQRISNLEAGI